MKEIATILSAFATLPTELGTVALATVVSVSGSSYRRPGARMLILPTGQTHGTVSGGCLEADIVERAQRVMRIGSPVVVKYDTTEDGDIVFGLGLGCQGVVQVLIEPISVADEPSHFTFLTQLVAERQPGVLATVFSGTAVSHRLTLRNDGSILTNIADPRLDKLVNRDAQTTFAAAKSCSRSYTTHDGRADVFFEFLKPPQPLLICGAGHDAEPLARFAAELGWHITIVDARPSYAVAGRFPPGTDVICARPETLLDHVEIEQSMAVVLMTHNYYHDRAFLETVLPSASSFIGILGPKRRAERLFKDLRDAGLTMTAEDRRRLHCPIGLDIGADSPEQIALSIIAEIQAESAGRTGNQLRDRRGPIYDSEDIARFSTDDQSWAEPLRGGDAGVSSIGLILLAAGASTRLGSPKQLLPFRGRSLLRGAAETALSSRCRPVIVVLGANADRLVLELSDLDVTAVVCQDWAVGMGASIHTGLEALQSVSASQDGVLNTGILITLCDQPLLTAALYDRFVDAHERAAHCPLVAAEYNGSLGVPALFDHTLYPELRALPADGGAKRLLQRYSEQTIRIQFPDAAVDIDTPMDYANLVADTPCV